MNYIFTRHIYDWLNIHVVTPPIGVALKKRYLPGVTPQNQATLNIYTLGKFEVTCEDAGFKQVFGIGESSFDLTIDIFPTDSISTEKPIETPACRVCFSAPRGFKWSRAASKVVKDEVVKVDPEQISMFVSATGWDGKGAPEVYVGSSFTARDDGFVYTVQREVL